MVSKSALILKIKADCDGAIADATVVLTKESKEKEFEKAIDARWKGISPITFPWRKAEPCDFEFLLAMACGECGAWRGSHVRGLFFCKEEQLH